MYFAKTIFLLKKSIGFCPHFGATHPGLECEEGGYEEWLDAQESGEYSISTVKKEIVRNSVKYAKRQMTFFNSFESVKWFDPRNTDNIRGYLEERGVSLS